MLSKPQERQVERFASAMMLYRSSHLTALFPCSAGFKAAWRFIHNPRVSPEALNNYLCSRRELASIGGPLLLIDDSTTTNFNSIRGKLKESDEAMGLLSNNKTTGQFYHTSLLWDTEHCTGKVLAVSPFIRAHDRRYYQKTDKIPYEDREGYRWYDMAKRGREAIPEGRQVIKVSDREADAYEHLVGCLDLDVDFVIRSKHNRKRVGEKIKLHDFAKGLTPRAQVTIPVERKIRPEAQANLALAWSPFCLQAPNDHNSKERVPLGRNLDLYVVIATELNPPTDSPPLQWILITSLAVDSAEKALDVMKIYRKRWVIEELFKILKSSCFNIEKTQLGKGLSIMRLTNIAMHMALEVLLLKENRFNEELEARTQFSDLEMTVLEACEKQVSGTSKALTNPYKPKSLAWAVWIIARMGGWNGQIKGQSPPGAKTLAKGLERFLDRVEWVAFQQRDQESNDNLT